MSEGIDKAAVYAAFMEHLEKELGEAVAASRDAAAYATDEEARAESKWDTQGLEASYLAAGQAGQAREWMRAIEAVRSQRESLVRPVDRAGPGALVKCVQAGEADWYYFVPAAGGQDLRVVETTVTTLTFQTPLAAALRGKRAGEAYVAVGGAAGTVQFVG
ncbi:MAG: hypothetical protein JJU00_19765 [Opitutales bacterium]|nr:hypothetical protein [Opitutales bacterium]